jgi:hypothetical protein
MGADPVLAGFADSLARPRGNMTGVTLMAVELLSPKSAGGSKAAGHLGVTAPP